MSPTPSLDARTLASLRRADPLVRGRSKTLWDAGDGVVLVELVPSLSSFTHGREEVFARTAPLRLDFYERAAARLDAAGVPTAFRERVSDTAYLAEWAPSPPFEVIVKNFAVGSTVRKYPGLFAEGERLPRPVVKFDYRVDPEDQPIGEDYLRLLGHPVEQWRGLALDVNAVLRDWLRPRVLVDFCVIVGATADGRQVIASEVSPDAFRLRGPDGRSLDKDLFRRGADEDTIARAWGELVSSLDARA